LVWSNWGSRPKGVLDPKVTGQLLKVPSNSSSNWLSLNGVPIPSVFEVGDGKTKKKGGLAEFGRGIVISQVGRVNFA